MKLPGGRGQRGLSAGGRVLPPVGHVGRSPWRSDQRPACEGLLISPQEKVLAAVWGSQRFGERHRKSGTSLQREGERVDRKEAAGWKEKLFG